MSYMKKRYLAMVLFLVPSLILIAIFIAYPFVQSILYSFTDWDGISPETNFVGFKNFIDLFHDRSFLSALKATFFFTFFGMLILNPCALLLALALNMHLKGQNALRAMFYLPMTISMVVVSNIWNIILSYDGYVNTILRSIGWEDGAKNWLSDYGVTLWVVLGILVWQSLGRDMIFYLAGLQSISPDLYEAAKIDGAGPGQRLVRITVPMLMPTITVVTFLQLSSLVRVFDLPMLLTNGGPGNLTVTVALLIYNQAFKYTTAGYATTTGVVLMLIVGIISCVQLRLTRSREVEV